MQTDRILLLLDLASLPEALHSLESLKAQEVIQEGVALGINHRGQSVTLHRASCRIAERARRLRSEEGGVTAVAAAAWVEKGYQLRRHNCMRSVERALLLLGREFQELELSAEGTEKERQSDG